MRYLGWYEESRQRSIKISRKDEVFDPYYL